jgi:hypothetical protein
MISEMKPVKPAIDPLQISTKRETLSVALKSVIIKYGVTKANPAQGTA